MPQSAASDAILSHIPTRPTHATYIISRHIIQSSTLFLIKIEFMKYESQESGASNELKSIKS